MALDDLYQEILLDHYKNPRNQGKLDDADVPSEAKNPFCGDVVTLNLKFENERVADIRFHGEGCVISQASVSLLTQYAKGKTVEEIRQLVDKFQTMLRGEGTEKIDEDLEELLALQGVADYPTRVKCATLAWNTLVKALNDHQHRHDDKEIAGHHHHEENKHAKG